MKKVLVMVFALVLISSFAGQALAQPIAPKVRVIVEAKSLPDAKQLVYDYGGKLRHSFPELNTVSADLPQELFDQLRIDRRAIQVRLAERVYATQDTLDWGVDRIDAEKVWGGAEDATDVATGRNAGDGIKVAILDTGIDWNHPDLADSYKGGHDFVNDDTDPMDDNGHGTHCAGIVAAEDNDAGVIGVAPKAYLYAVKVLDSSGSGYEDDVAAGIQWCIDNGIQIISMSLGSDSDLPLVKEKCDAAYNAGLLLVAAAGNDGWSKFIRDTVDYPARYSSVIAVGATDSSDNRAVWGFFSASSTGPDLELMAPGDEINSTYWDDTYETLSGTSMACPMVAGTAALVWKAFPDYTNVEVRERLQSTAEDLGDPGRDDEFGYGLVDAEAAATPPDTPPTVSIVNPADGTTVAGSVLIQVSASDDKGVSSVEYSIDDGTYNAMTYNSTSGYWEATWDSTTVADGSHAITARATDTISQMATDSITVTVDNVDEPPTVSITEPAEGAFVSGTITIEASASDDRGIEKVEFYVDDGLLATDTTAPYECSWDTTTAADGSYGIKAVATDTAGQTGSNMVTVTVDNTAPVVDVVEPAEGATVSGMITIKASVTEINVDKVEYRIDTGNFATMTYNETSGYWEADWDSTAVTNGAHTVTVQATDKAGNSAKDTNNFTVDNPVQTMHVASLDMNLVERWRGWRTYAEATPMVVDFAGNPVEGATVSGHWEGATSDTDSGLTDASGKVTFQSDAVWKAESGTTFTFVIDDVTKDGWTYDPSANGDFDGDGKSGDTSNSISVP